MYKLIQKFNEGDLVTLKKSFQGQNIISLVNPTQSQLKYLFETLGHPYVIKEEKDGKTKKD